MWVKYEIEAKAIEIEEEKEVSEVVRDQIGEEVGDAYVEQRKK